MNKKDNAKHFQLLETFEPMILMSASAAELTVADLSESTSGNDVMISLTPDELLDGAGGHDILVGLGGNNVLRGGDGHDTLISVRGDNVLDGGAGVDKAVYWNGNRADYEVIDHGFGIVEVIGDKHSDFITNIEQVQFQDGTYSLAELLTGEAKAPATGDFSSEDAATQTLDNLKGATAGKDILIANAESESIDGLAGDDLIIGLGNGNSISGNSGDDAVVSAGGNNLIDGGEGSDTVIYTGVKAGYTLAQVDGGAMSVTSVAGTDILMNVESVSFQDATVAVNTAVSLPFVDEPVVEVPVVEVPVEEVPVEEVPVDEVPVEEVPVEEVPVEEVPVDEVPVDEVPVDEVPVDEVPVDEVPVDEVPVDEVPVDEVPVEEVPVEEVPVEEVPVDEVPVDEVPVDEVPVDEVPVDEVPVDEVPVDEVPVDGPVADYSLHLGGDLYGSVATEATGIHYQLVSIPASGSINFYGNGDFDFHADPHFNGVVKFEYASVDAYGHQIVHEVAINVAGISPGYGPAEEPADNDDVQNGNDDNNEGPVNNDEPDHNEDEAEVVDLNEEPQDDHDVDVVEVDGDEPENNCDNVIELPCVENNDRGDDYASDNTCGDILESVCDVVEDVVSCFDGFLGGLFDCHTYSTPTYCEPTYTSYNYDCGSHYNYNSCYTTSSGWGWNLFSGWCW